MCDLQKHDDCLEDHIWEQLGVNIGLLLSKHADYGARNISDAPGGPLNGLRVRMHDKLARINHLIDNDQKPNYEALDDSFLDLANYALIAQLVLNGHWEE